MSLRCWKRLLTDKHMREKRLRHSCPRKYLRLVCWYIFNGMNYLFLFAHVSNLSFAFSFSIRKYIDVSDDVLLHALVLLDRLIVSTGGDGKTKLTPTSVHRSLASAILVAQKYTDEVPYGNKYYARAFLVYDVKGIPYMIFSTR